MAIDIEHFENAWKAARLCLVVPGSKGCHCPLIVYENEDGRCSHYACEGNHQECGRPVAIIDWKAGIIWKPGRG